VLAPGEGHGGDANAEQPEGDPLRPGLSAPETTVFGC
jgi:hypothetical protein